MWVGVDEGKHRDLQALAKHTHKHARAHVGVALALRSQLTSGRTIF